MLLEGKGAVEELLGDHGEELGLALRAIGVEEADDAPTKVALKYGVEFKGE